MSAPEKTPDAAPPAGPRARPVLGAVTLGFATTVAMWAVAYVCRLPGVQAPGWALLPLLLSCVLCGGGVAGRWIEGPAAWVGAKVGAIASLLNLLILGSFLADGRAQAATWVPGTLAIGAAVAAVGALVGRKTAKAPPAPRRWSATFARVAVVATVLLLAVGGIVTGNEAGLAVPDWPNSFQSNMFFYPLSRMTGGIYYEHAHRLFGSLVGLTTLTLAVVILLDDTRGWLRGLGGVAFLLVCVQGLLGGLRVTGTLTTSAHPDDLAPSLALAVVHGVTGQVFFALLVAIAAFTSETWRSETARLRKGLAAQDLLSGSTILVAAVLVQLVLGALVRHFDTTVTWHITMAVVVVVLAIVNGVRARATQGELPVLPTVGMTVLYVVGLQFLLGVGALATTIDTSSALGKAQVPVTTLHQTTGALLLGCAVLLRLWTQRLLDPTPEPEQAPSSPT